MENVLLFFMSFYPARKMEENYYKYSDGDAVVAGHTNMGPTRALISFLEKKKEHLDKVIYLASSTVRGEKKDQTTKDGEETPGNKLFEQDLQSWILQEKYESKVAFETIEVDDQFEDRDIMERIIEMTETIKQESNVYVDFSGGLRQASSLLLSVARILKYKGVNNVIILTNQYNSQQEYPEDDPLIIKDNVSVFGAVDYVSATKYFLGTGDIRELDAWFRENVSTLQPKEIEIAKAFKEFYNGIILCRTENTMVQWENIINALKEYKDSEGKSKTFYNVVELFEDAMKRKDEENTSVISLIRWCLEHDLMQQALTLFDEKMPGVINTCFDKKNDFLLKWPSEVPEDKKKSYLGIYEELTKESKENDVDWTKCVEFKSFYLLLEAMRDYVNHASERKNAGKVNNFYEALKKEDFFKEFEEKNEIHGAEDFQKILEASCVKKILYRVLDDIGQYQSAFDKVLTTTGWTAENKYMEENSTIIVPIQFNCKKRWKGFERQVFNHLKRWNKNAHLKWKKMMYSKETGEGKSQQAIMHKDFIDSVVAFDMDTNKISLEQEYFYEEAFQAIYDTKYTSSCFYMLTNVQGDVLLEKEGMKVFFGEKKERKVRKVYLYLTNIHTGLLVVEMLPEKNATEGEIDSIVNEIPKIGNEKETSEQLDLWVFGKKRKGNEFFLPFKRKCFLATIMLENECASCMKGNELKQENVEIEAFLMRGKGVGDDAITSFFAHYFLIYLLCVLQKTEVLHISYMTGVASREKVSRIIKNRVEEVNQEYVLFYNQYDMVSCTYDEEGSEVYRRLREGLLIEQDSEVVRGQMKDLLEYATLVSGRTTNILLAVLSAVGTIVSAYELVPKLFSAISKLSDLISKVIDFF